jgi:hypothetical protein
MDSCSEPVCFASMAVEWPRQAVSLSVSPAPLEEEISRSLSLRLKFPLDDVRTISSHKAQQEIQLGVFTGSFSYLSATTRFFVMTVSLNHMQVSLLSLSNHTFLSMTISINHTFLPNDKSLRDDSNNKPANALKQAKYPDVCFHNFHS